jgi:hypothetical protein
VVKTNKSKIEEIVEFIISYFAQKAKKSKLYRFMVKAYGVFAIVVGMLAVSAIDYNPVGAILWLIGLPIGYIVIHLTIITLSFVGFALYTILEDLYCTK